jgi:hypothetical protein
MNGDDEEVLTRGVRRGSSVGFGTAVKDEG